MKIKFESISKDLVYKAYRYLKNYVYYDYTSLFLRESISNFESDDLFEDNIDKLYKFLNSNDNKNLSNYIEKLCNKISFRTYIKNIETEKTENTNVISNRMIYDEYKVHKLIYLIDAPIELHLISMIWVMKAGYLLESDYKNCCYAYKLGFNDYSIFSNPYYKQYSAWRDNAIKKAKIALEDNNDVLILSLDIKEYYNSVKLNFEALKEYLISKECDSFTLKLTKYLEIIYNKYHRILLNEIPNSNCILPIGLLSSGIIANWYIRNFDTKVIKSINPLYYGRYVDDILIVLINPIINKTNPELLLIELIDKYFIKNDLLSEYTNDDKQKKEKTKNIRYYLNDFPNLSIQSSKINLYSLLKNNSSAVIDKFVNKIKENSSEFRFLPEDEKLKREFIEEANQIYYSDSINKLRSVENFYQDKYGASKFLAKLIYTSLLSEAKIEDKTIYQILKFFRGKVNLDFFTLFEKLFTFFVISNLEKELKKLLNDIFTSLYKLDFSKFEGINPYDNLSKLKDKVVNDLIKYIYISLSLSFSLEPKFLNDKFILFFEKKIKKYKLDFVFDIESLPKIFRKTNMIRHDYVFYPLINYTALNEENYSYVNKYNLNTIININEIFEIELDNSLVKYTPRRVSFYECCVFSIYNYLFNNNQETPFISKIYLKKASQIYETINGSSLPVFIKDTINNSVETLENKLNYQYFNIEYSSKTDDKIKVGIANTKISYDDILNNLDNKPNLSHKRKQEIFELLNSVLKENVEIFVLPEFYIPFAWLDFITTFSKRHKLAIVTGLEHFVINNTAYNFVATILPFKNNYFNDAIPILRLKNHYAPLEENIILNEKRMEIPNYKIKIYDLFKWRNVSFSVYYCYELANIIHRGLFKSKVDFLIASEYNKDIKYFSNIVESVVRDVHCYFIQVNSSDFGDSRITQPTKSEIMNLVRTKGGINSTFLTENLDILNLRKFQKMNIVGQKLSNSSFKLTPPDFDHDEVDNR